MTDHLPATARFVAKQHATRPWTPGEKVSVHVDDERIWGTVRRVIAGRLLIIELPSGRRIRRRAL